MLDTCGIWILAHARHSFFKIKEYCKVNSKVCNAAVHRCLLNSILQKLHDFITGIKIIPITCSISTAKISETKMFLNFDRLCLSDMVQVSKTSKIPFLFTFGPNRVFCIKNAVICKFSILFHTGIQQFHNGIGCVSKNFCCVMKCFFAKKHPRPKFYAYFEGWIFFFLHSVSKTTDTVCLLPPKHGQEDLFFF